MLEQFPPQPDDTAEIVAVPAGRPIALLVSAAVVAIGVLIGVGFLAFGGLGNASGASSTLGLPAISPDASAPPSIAAPSTSPLNEPTAEPTTTAAPTPVTAMPTLTPTTLPAVAVSIANATMKPPTYQGADCPGSTTAVATVVVSGPVTITYRWATAAVASPPGGTASFTFGTAGSHQFSHPFTDITTPNGQLNAAFVIVTPVARRTSMSYTQKCGASASKITPKITKSPPALTCSVTFTSTMHAGVGPMTVKYHWKFTGPGPGNETSSLSFGRGGGTQTVASAPRTLANGNKITATLILDSPVHFQTATVTAACP